MDKLFQKKALWIKAVGQGLMVLIIAVFLAGGYIILYSFLKSESNSQTPVIPSQTKPVITAVTALGRLEPQGEVLRLSAPTSTNAVRIEKLLVREGDRVTVGQIIAILDGYQRRLADLNKAKEQVNVAQARLLQVKAGAAPGEITAQEAITARLEAQLKGETITNQATIARLEAQLQGEKSSQKASIARIQAELRNAETEFRRYENLHKEGAIEAIAYDSKRLQWETSQERLREANATLNRTVETLQEQIKETQATHQKTLNTLQQQIKESIATRERIAEVRPTDIDVAQAEVNNALASVKQAEAELQLAYVRSPIDAKVLKIYAYPGETVGNQGIADLGQTNQMYAIAEVYETDISRVHIGQSATISSRAFIGDLQGTVTHIGFKVGQQGIFSTSPRADTDRKIIEVKVRLNDSDASQKVAHLTNLQVQVAIHIPDPNQQSSIEPETDVTTNLQPEAK